MQAAERIAIESLPWTDRHLFRLIALKRVLGGPGANTLESSQRVARIYKAIRYLHSRRRR